jgi:hypothetical protein
VSNSERPTPLGLKPAGGLPFIRNRGFVIATSSHPPTASGTHLIELPLSLATVAASLVSCPHPDDSRVSANILSTGRSERITWCSFCGAMATAATDKGPRVEELSQLLHALRKGSAALSQEADRPPETRTPPETLLRALSAALSELTATRLARDLDQLDCALAQMR